MTKMSNFSWADRSTNSIAWKRWLLWNKWILKWPRKEESLWANLAIILVGCCKLSLYANESCVEHAFYFRRWLKWRVMFITFLLPVNDVSNFSRIEALDVRVFIHSRSIKINSKTNRRIGYKSKYLEEYSIVKKVGRERLLARKSCFL